MPKPPDLEGEIIGPHEYNNKNLSPKEFLLAVMHDHRIPLQARMEAARNVAVFEHPRLAQVSQDVTSGITIKIEGGLPPLPGTNIIMPGDQPVTVAPVNVYPFPSPPTKPPKDDPD